MGRRCSDNFYLLNHRGSVSMKQDFYTGDMALLDISEPLEKECLAEVVVKEVKNAYGRVRYVVAPTRGKGNLTREKLVKIKK